MISLADQMMAAGIDPDDPGGVEFVVAARTEDGRCFISMQGRPGTIKDLLEVTVSHALAKLRECAVGEAH